MGKQGTLRKLLLQIESAQTEQLLNELGIELQDNEGNIKLISKIIEEVSQVLEKIRGGDIMEGEKWCNYYQCWCDDAEFIIEDNGYCDFNCNNCHHREVS